MFLASFFDGGRPPPEPPSSQSDAFSSSSSYSFSPSSSSSSSSSSHSSSSPPFSSSSSSSSSSLFSGLGFRASSQPPWRDLQDALRRQLRQQTGPSTSSAFVSTSYSSFLSSSSSSPQTDLTPSGSLAPHTSAPWLELQHALRHKLPQGGDAASPSSHPAPLTRSGEPSFASPSCSSSSPPAASSAAAAAGGPEDQHRRPPADAEVAAPLYPSPEDGFGSAVSSFASSSSFFVESATPAAAGRRGASAKERGSPLSAAHATERETKTQGAAPPSPAPASASARERRQPERRGDSAASHPCSASASAPRPAFSPPRLFPVAASAPPAAAPPQEPGGRSFAAALDSLTVEPSASPQRSLFAPTKLLQQVTARSLPSTCDLLLGDGSGGGAEREARALRGGGRDVAEAATHSTGERTDFAQGLQAQRQGVGPPEARAKAAQAARPENADEREEGAETQRGSGLIGNAPRADTVLHLPAKSATHLRFLTAKTRLEPWLPYRLSAAQLAASGLLPDPARWRETAPRLASWLASRLATHAPRGGDEEARLRAWLCPAASVAHSAPRPRRESERDCVFADASTQSAAPPTARPGACSGSEAKMRAESSALAELAELREAVREQTLQHLGQGARENRLEELLTRGRARVDALLCDERDRLRRLLQDREGEGASEGGEREKSGGLVRATADALAQVADLGMKLRRVQVAALDSRQRAGDAEEATREDADDAEAKPQRTEAGAEEEALVAQLVSRLEDVALLEMKEKFIVQLIDLLELTDGARGLIDRLALLSSPAPPASSPLDSPPSSRLFLSEAGRLLFLLTRIAETCQRGALPPFTRRHAQERLAALLRLAFSTFVTRARASLKAIAWGLTAPPQPVGGARSGKRSSEDANQRARDGEDAGESGTPFSALFLTLGGLFALQQLELTCLKSQEKRRTTSRKAAATGDPSSARGEAENRERMNFDSAAETANAVAAHLERMWPVQALAAPLVTAFKFHFCREGGGPLARLDKPEWAREFVVHQLERHEDLLYDPEGVAWVEGEDGRLAHILEEAEDVSARGSPAARVAAFLLSFGGGAGSLAGCVDDDAASSAPPPPLPLTAESRDSIEGPREAVKHREAQGLKILEVAACSMAVHMDPLEGLQLVLADAFRQFLLDRMPLLVFAPVAADSPPESAPLPQPAAEAAPPSRLASALSAAGGRSTERGQGSDGGGAGNLAGAGGEQDISGTASSQRAPSAHVRVEVAAPDSGSASLFLFHLQQALDLSALWKEQGSVKAASVVMRDFDRNSRVFPPGCRRAPRRRIRRKTARKRADGGGTTAGELRDKGQREQEDRQHGKRAKPFENEGRDSEEAGKAQAAAAPDEAADVEDRRAGGRGRRRTDAREEAQPRGGFSLLRGLVTAALCEDEDEEGEGNLSEGERLWNLGRDERRPSRGREGARSLRNERRKHSAGAQRNHDGAESGADSLCEASDGDGSSSAVETDGERSQEAEVEEDDGGEEEGDWLALGFFDREKTSEASPGPVGMLDFWITLDSAFLLREADRLIAAGATTQPHALASLLQHSRDLQTHLSYSNELVVAAVALFEAALPRVGALSNDGAIERFYKGVFSDPLRRLTEALKSGWNSLDTLAASPALCGMLLESTNALCLYLSPQECMREANQENAETKEEPSFFLLRAFFRRFLPSEVEALDTMRSRMEAFLLLEVSEHVETAARRVAKAPAPVDAALELLSALTAPLHPFLQRDLRLRALAQVDRRLFTEAMAAVPAGGRDTRILLGENCMHARTEACRLFPDLTSQGDELLPRTYAAAKVLLDPSAGWLDASQKERIEMHTQALACASSDAETEALRRAGTSERAAETAVGGERATRREHTRGERAEENLGHKLKFFINPLARVQHAAGALWQMAAVDDVAGSEGETPKDGGDAVEQMRSRSVQILEETLNLPRGVLAPQELLQLASLHAPTAR
ncbi:hypothetical protein BESB_010480 [Besnoitia besnoiti]|uniref:Uncharacterized protein n=1 Tax=Besnoitia besnoiti TaxID=94643 RepID=A0A2A9MQB1_BESBE|nr:hypothetical protein BESB_010480 [Besnoitia besnoiti]PFH38706.1 hypothetical protein BESB_010480 [Besnoitia besnoiti]